MTGMRRASGNYARVGRIHAVDVREDLTPLRPQGRRERHRRGIRPPAPERHDVTQGVDPLKTGDDGDLALVEQAAQAVGLYPRDDPRTVASRNLHARLRAGERGGCDAPVVQGHRQQGHGLELARRK